MHEHHLIEHLIHKIETVAREKQAKKVTALKVWLGALSHFSATHFFDHFERASKGTLCEGAHLDITLSADIQHKNAQGVLLESVEIAP